MSSINVKMKQLLMIYQNFENKIDTQVPMKCENKQKSLCNRFPIANKVSLLLFSKIDYNLIF